MSATEQHAGATARRIPACRAPRTSHGRARWLAACCGALAMAGVQAQELRESVQLAAPETPAPAGPSAAASIETHAELQTLLSLGEFELAMQIGQEVVDNAAQAHGETSRELADAYMILGETQRFAQEHLEAETSYLAAIEILREIDGFDAVTVVEPLTSLGDNYYEAAFYDNAVTAYTEARDLHRRNHGLLDPDQIPLITRNVRSLLQLRDFEQANAHQIEVVNLLERAYSPGSPEMLAGVYGYSRWLRRLGLVREARMELERAVRVVEKHQGDTSPQLVGTYRELALIGGNMARVRVMLNEALEVAEAQDPPDPLLVAGVLMDLGDAELEGGAEASEYYLTAWEALEPHENADEIRVAWFGQIATTVRFDMPTVDSWANKRRADAGDMTVFFEVDEDNRPREITVVRQGPLPTELLDLRTLESMRRTRFDPEIFFGQYFYNGNF